jgi:DNA-binding LacI/PurR family transcriptional regulator
MPQDKITSLHVAQRAGVSQSAVSRVFTPGASASRIMTSKVRKAAAELGYRPNVLARSLIKGRSRIIGLVVAYLENQFYPDTLEKLSTLLQEKGYHVLVFMASQTADNIDTVLEEILDYQIDGLIMASVALSSELAERCVDAGIPVVLFNRAQDDERLSTITSDNLAGGRKLAEFLLAGGHQRIGYIAGWEQASTQRDREQGFVAGLHAAGRQLYCREWGNFSFEQAKIAARKMFSPANKPWPDAVFVANDHMAFAVLETLRFELGLRVPEDVSVVGYDDVPLAAWASFNLTTVRQPANRMAQQTVATLMTHIEEGDPTPRRIAIGGPLIVRGSARLPAHSTEGY